MPVVAVWMVTYNHGPYIARAIESVMMQQTSFDFKLYIGEDCSTDNTRQICLQMQQQYPGRIELILHEKNIGATANGIFMYEVCFASGAAYVALLEGDDYWTDKQKLQQQVSFLETHKDYALCFHDVKKLVNNKQKTTPEQEIPDTTDINYLLSHKGYISTPAVVYRNNQLAIDMLHKMDVCPFGDYIVYVAAARQGLIKYIPKSMAVYRVHGSGMWSASGNKQLFEKILLGFKLLYLQLPKEQGDMLKMRYLATLEAHFLQDEIVYSEEEFEKIAIAEMQVEPYVINYLKQQATERKKASFYAENVSIQVLIKALIHKFTNKLR